MMKIKERKTKKKTAGVLSVVRKSQRERILKYGVADAQSRLTTTFGLTDVAV